MKNSNLKSLDAAVAILGFGLVLGVLARIVENSRPLAQMLGF